MRLPGRTERRVALIFVLMAALPLVIAVFVTRAINNRAIALFYNPEIIAEVERSLGVYTELAQAMKSGLRAKADAIAAQEPLRAAAILRDGPSIDQELRNAFQLYPDLVSITLLAPTADDPDAPDDPDAVKAPEGKVPDEPLPDARKPPVLGHRDRGFPVDKATERELSVVRPLDKREGGPSLKVVFAADRKTLDHITEASEFLATYRLLNREKKAIDQAFFEAYLAAGFCVSLFAALIGRVLARYVTRRIEALAAATQAVGAGDLTVRVPVEGQDELTDLARAFNRMLGELTESRARIEFLGKMGTWQEMARRLAHEIKNPLTPIQLAVQECHLRYDGSNRSFRKLLDTTREIVEEEVGTLRRLVTEFSNFARLPRASLEEGDLAAYLREQRDKLAVTEGDGEDEAGLLQGVVPRWSLPSRPLMVAFDPFLLHRVLVNLTANAAQAIRGVGAAEGQVQITVRDDGEPGVATLDVDDSGPGIDEGLRERIFDPYFTTKSDGNGLGLAIVKKIIVEHGGTIEAAASPQGGARLRIRLPLLGTPASQVALAHSGGQSLPPASPHAP